MKQIVVVAVFALLASACDSGANKDAQKVASVLTGDSKGAASDNPICKLFKPGELEAYAGEALNAGGNAGLGYACQWTAKDGEGNVMVTIVGADDAEIPSLAPGFRKLPDIGTRGFVVNDMGWAAGAVRGKDFVKVSISGPKASDATAIALLKETLKRQP